MKDLIKKGAEASLYLAHWHGKHVMIKERLPKKYRPKQLDQTIRRSRTMREPQLMHAAKRAGVPTPTILMVDIPNAVIIMEYIEGKQIKQVLDSATMKEREALCLKVGALVAKLHLQGLVHGDLTTSNMILTESGRVFFVDFGLSDRTPELEAQGVDLHLLKRALQSTHYRVADECFNAILKGYASELGVEGAKTVLDKVREIERRGRYVAERRQEE